MTPVEQERERLLGEVQPLPPRTVDLDAARGLVLAGDAVATLDVPRFDASAMDGWAVRADDPALRGRAAQGLEVLAQDLAGRPSGATVVDGTTVAVMTGAPLPPGADAVVPVERTAHDDGQVRVSGVVRPGDHVRRRAEDGRDGDVLARAGEHLTARLAGALAAAGVQRVHVHPRPRVLVLTTGDELVGPGADLGTAGIPDSGRHAVVGLLEEAGLPAAHRHARDDPQELADVLVRASRDVDAVVSTGGVSAGAADHLADVLARVGRARPVRLALRPGKPFVSGRVGDAVVLGLPGNPGAAAVVAALLALPVLRRLAGRAPGPLPLPAVAADDLPRRPDGRLHVRAVRLAVADDARLHARPVEAHGSHQQRASARADGWVLLPDGTGVLAGGLVEVLPHPGWAPTAVADPSTGEPSDLAGATT